MAKLASFHIIMWVVIFSIVITNVVGIYKANIESQMLLSNVEIISENLSKMSDIQLKLVESEMVKIRKQRELSSSQISPT